MTDAGSDDVRGTVRVSAAASSTSSVAQVIPAAAAAAAAAAVAGRVVGGDGLVGVAVLEAAAVAAAWLHLTEQRRVGDGVGGTRQRVAPAVAAALPLAVPVPVALLVVRLGHLSTESTRVTFTHFVFLLIINC